MVDTFLLRLLCLPLLMSDREYLMNKCHVRQFLSYDGLIFFFQAEDGIRDRNVTGVQTCALPICDGLFSVIIAAVIGIPMYIRPETMLPIAEALISKGMSMGTVIALVIGGAGASI